MTRPDAAAAVVWTERATAALRQSRLLLALADAVNEQADPAGDTIHGDARRETYRALCRAADVQESYSEQCQDMARDARTVRGVAS